MHPAFKKLDPQKVAQVLALKINPHHHASNYPGVIPVHPPLPAKPRRPMPAAYAAKLARRKTRRAA